MAQHLDFGAKGEQLAAEFLAEHGFSLLDRNWHSGHHELDIVCEWHGEVVFVEVKTRTNESYSTAESAVGRRKQEMLREAAHSWLRLHGRLDSPYRYDIITIVGQQPPYQLSHFRRAFA